MKTVGLLDPTNPKKGIYIQYGGGDKCTNGDNPLQNGKPRQTKFNIYCAEKADEVLKNKIIKKYIKLFMKMFFTFQLKEILEDFYY